MKIARPELIDDLKCNGKRLLLTNRPLSKAKKFSFKVIDGYIYTNTFGDISGIIDAYAFESFNISAGYYAHAWRKIAKDVWQLTFVNPYN
ncbi:hypothetical protein [Brevibacillus sp. NRS-1366]|uniref:hypothetical protein n=1 Tax=Brevibacillus sp. NRS-1366 TaxID=3233899 RepID=UPI003D1AA0EC